MGEAVRRAHETYEEAKKELIEAVEVIDRKITPDVAIYRVNRKKPAAPRRTPQDRF